MDLSGEQARIAALASQGFGQADGALTSMAKRLGLIQIDSVNVLVRSHYLPLFSRLGAYDPGAFDALAYDPHQRGLFEYWGHEASLIPLEFFPLFRWRMARAAKGEAGWGGVIRFGRENPKVIARALEEVRHRGPMGASELTESGKSQGSWWGWSQGKKAMEYLFWTGQITTAARRNNFERIYDLTERVIPAQYLNAKTPDEKASQQALIMIAARAMGVATLQDLRDYFRLSLADTRARIADLCAAKLLSAVTVEGWRHPAYMPGGLEPGPLATGAALLSPFDNLIWERNRAERLFGTRIKLEIYTPEDQRAYGYYVLPFLFDGRVAARVDLKADRKAGVLLVHAAHLEPGAEPIDTADALAGELSKLSTWLKLGPVKVSGRRKFDNLLRKSLRRL